MAGKTILLRAVSGQQISQSSSALGYLSIIHQRDLPYHPNSNTPNTSRNLSPTLKNTARKGYIYRVAILKRRGILREAKYFSQESMSPKALTSGNILRNVIFE
ncbi:hypothetical protein AVEN_126566-1 [Araneus ventricosus]|uniref:Uncharacterized protein n=1 Tax=Araneus ventricosus TaxID=182803 RepID=A0A4Y2SQD8_ARAVE|nr:hypothetical protein AVEN_126566-1 [Araneus ventricosus]